LLSLTATSDNKCETQHRYQLDRDKRMLLFKLVYGQEKKNLVGKNICYFYSLSFGKEKIADTF
jgi:hypothetical protein